MKKALSLIMSITLILGIVGAFASCGSTKTVSGTTPSTKNTTAQSDYAYIKNKGELIVGITEYKPMDYKDKNGNWTGFDVEYGNAVAQILGVKIKFIVIDWDNKVQELDAKTVDCVWNGMTITDELKKSMSITNPYAQNSQVVVMNAKNAAKYKDKDSMKSLKFAVESGSSGQNAAKNAGFKATAVSAQSDALMEVASGSADACVIDLTMANAMTGKGTSYENLSKTITLSLEQYGIGCRTNSDLVAKINDATKTLVANGKMAELAKKYNIELTA